MCIRDSGTAEPDGLPAAGGGPGDVLRARIADEEMCIRDRPLTASAIKYLLILLELCKNETGARCMDIAGQLHVTKPSVHSMIGNLSSAGLAEKKKYGNVFLTPAGRAEAERYAGCCQQLSSRMQQSLGLNAEDAYSAACAVLAQLPRLPEQLQTRKEGASWSF